MRALSRGAKKASLICLIRCEKTLSPASIPAAIVEKIVVYPMSVYV